MVDVRIKNGEANDELPGLARRGGEGGLAGPCNRLRKSFAARARSHSFLCSLSSQWQQRHISRHPRDAGVVRRDTGEDALPPSHVLPSFHSTLSICLTLTNTNLPPTLPSLALTPFPLTGDATFLSLILQFFPSLSPLLYFSLFLASPPRSRFFLSGYWTLASLTGVVRGGGWVARNLWMWSSIEYRLALPLVLSIPPNFHTPSLKILPPVKPNQFRLICYVKTSIAFAVLVYLYVRCAPPLSAPPYPASRPLLPRHSSFSSSSFCCYYSVSATGGGGGGGGGWGMKMETAETETDIKKRNGDTTISIRAAGSTVGERGSTLFYRHSPLTPIHPLPSFPLVLVVRPGM